MGPASPTDLGLGLEETLACLGEAWWRYIYKENYEKQTNKNVDKMNCRSVDIRQINKLLQNKRKCADFVWN